MSSKMHRTRMRSSAQKTLNLATRRFSCLTRIESPSSTGRVRPLDNAGNARLPGKPDHSSHRFHLEQHYTKRMFSTLEGK